jgi:hypothetical protein
VSACALTERPQGWCHVPRSAGAPPERAASSRAANTTERTDAGLLPPPLNRLFSLCSVFVFCGCHASVMFPGRCWDSTLKRTRNFLPSQLKKSCLSKCFINCWSLNK